MVPPRAAQRPAPEATQKLPRVPTEAQVRAAVKPAPPPFVRDPAASEPAPEDSPPSSAETAPEAPTPEAVAEAKPEPKPASKPEPKSESKSEPVSAPPPAPQTAATPAAPAAASVASGYLIQIAAVREPERAESEWGRLQRQHPDTLRGLKLVVVRADLGDKGVFWRLRAGPFADEAAAKARCADLAKRKVGCMVVKAGG